MESALRPNRPQSVERSEGPFCHLPDSALRDFELLKTSALYRRGTNLFREGQAAQQIFIVDQGRVRLSVSAESGKSMTLRIAQSGEILGLSAALAGTPHEMTAELLEDAEVATIQRKDLLCFLHEHRDACLQVVNLLSQDLHMAYDRVRCIGLTRSRRPRSLGVH